MLREIVASPTQQTTRQATYKVNFSIHLRASSTPSSTLLISVPLPTLVAPLPPALPPTTPATALAQDAAERSGCCFVSACGSVLASTSRIRSHQAQWKIHVCRRSRQYTKTHDSRQHITPQTYLCNMTTMADPRAFTLLLSNKIDALILFLLRDMLDCLGHSL